MISKVIPYKKRTVCVTDAHNYKSRQPLRGMEHTVRKAYGLFKSEYPDVKIKMSSFTSIRPRNVRLAREA